MKKIILATIMGTILMGSGSMVAQQSITKQNFQPGMGPGPVIIPQDQQKAGPIIPFQGGGIGPVVVSQSNFYFSGQFYVDGDKLYFLDCATGRSLPVQKSEQYQAVMDKYGHHKYYDFKMNLASFRGFIHQEKMEQSLVVTYLNNMTMGENCPINSNVIGTYVGVSEAPGNGPMLKAILTMHGNYSFTIRTFNMNTGNLLNATYGHWSFTDLGKLALFYTNNDPYLAPQAMYNSNDSQITFTNSQGVAFSLNKQFM